MSLSVQASAGAAHLSAYGAVVAPLLAPPLPPQDHGRAELPLHLVTFRQLHSGQQVRQIQHLREDFLLPAAVREAPAFLDLEKKETRRVWSARSNAWAASSEPSASCR
ncbi:MAG TPA: hypothetical protein VEA40_04210 [Ramlibacter sp.]|nr:hypothetical protein [Ramlibacter sp.]